MEKLSNLVIAVISILKSNNKSMIIMEMIMQIKNRNKEMAVLVQLLQLVRKTLFQEDRVLLMSHFSREMN
jgi:hypothetical protein